MRSHFIEHNEKQIFLADYTNMSVDEFEQEIKAVTEAVCAEPPGSVITITDVRGVLASPQIIKWFLWSAPLTKSYIRKLAIVGIGFSNARKKLLDLVLKASGQTGIVFDDLEQAKDWLTTD